MSETIHQRIDAIVEDFTHAAASDARLGSCAACSHPSCERKRQEERDARIAGRELAEYIAAARAEVEKLKRHAVLREIDCANEMARANAAEEERDRMAEEVGQLTADLAAVRKVEEWHGGLTGRHIVQCADGRFVAAHYPAQQTAGAERIAAGPLDLVSLGRALAAQEGDDDAA